MEPRIRSQVKTREERQKKYLEGYLDFHRLNYILREEFELTYELTEDREIELNDLHHELYDSVFDRLYQDFFEESSATKEELQIYSYEPTIACIELCIKEYVKGIRVFWEGKLVGEPRQYYVPVR